MILHLIFVLLSISVTFTFYFLLFVDMFRPHGYLQVLTPEDGRVRPKHVDE
jgi:hypothetical protein